MKKSVSIVIVLSLLIALLVPAPVYAKVTFREASINDFEGIVKVIIAGGQKQYDAYKGMGLTQGDTVITSESSSVTLYIDDDKEIKLGANSRLTLSELSNYIDSQSKSTGLKLWAGKIWVSVKKKLNIRSKFEITTGSTVMGVKGTEFYVGYEPVTNNSQLNGAIRSQTSYGAMIGGQTSLVVLQGTVAATVNVPFQLQPTVVSPPGVPPAPPAPMVINVGANQVLSFRPDQLESGGVAPQPVPVQQQDLDLLVLRQIALNPEAYPTSLTQNLGGAIQQREAQEEQERQQRAEELAQRPTPPPPQYLLNVGPLPTLSPAPTPTATPYTYNPPTATPTASVQPTPSTSPSPDPSGAPLPSPVPGNETVTIISPLTDDYINTQEGLTIDMTATSHENDLMGVVVCLRKGSQGLYYDDSVGTFSSQTPLYTHAAHEGAHWYLTLSHDAFAEGDEFTCIVSAIAYDSADGVETTGSFYVDNIPPAFVVDPYIPMGLYPDNVNASHTVKFEFTEMLNDDGKANIESIISEHTISGGDNLKYTWMYNVQNQHQYLTVGLQSQDGEAIEFMDSDNIKTRMYDRAGNENTAAFYDVSPVDAPAVSPKYVQLDGEQQDYHTNISEFTIPLPDGHSFSGLMDALLESSMTDWSKYITLGGELENCSISDVNIDFSGDCPKIVVDLETNSDGNLNFTHEGDGTIVFSTRLWSGPGAFGATIRFSSHGIGLSASTSVTPDQVKFQWTSDIVSENQTVKIMVERSDQSATEGYESFGYVTITPQDHNIVLSGSEAGKEYWFRVTIIGGNYNGYTRIIHYTLPLFTATMNTITPVEIGWRQQDSRDLEINVSNPDITNVTFDIEDETIASIWRDGTAIYFEGLLPGTTDVTVTVEMPGYQNITQTFQVTVEDPPVAAIASPSAISQIPVSGHLVADSNVITITLPQGYSFISSFSDANNCIENYVYLVGALSGCSVGHIEQVDSRNATIYLATENFDGSYYTPLDDWGDASVLLVGDLLNEDEAVIANIAVNDYVP